MPVALALLLLFVACPAFGAILGSGSVDTFENDDCVNEVSVWAVTGAENDCDETGTPAPCANCGSEIYSSPDNAASFITTGFEDTAETWTTLMLQVRVENDFVDSTQISWAGDTVTRLTLVWMEDENVLRLTAAAFAACTCDVAASLGTWYEIMVHYDPGTPQIELYVDDLATPACVDTSCGSADATKDLDKTTLYGASISTSTDSAMDCYAVRDADPGDIDPCSDGGGGATRRIIPSSFQPPRLDWMFRDAFRLEWN